MSIYEDDLRRYKRLYEEEYQIVAKCWEAIGISSYEGANGKSIYELIAECRAKADRCGEAVERVTVAPNVDGQDFYELCQAYRHSKEIMPHGMPNTVQAFNNLREYIKTGTLPWPSYDVSEESKS